MFQVRLIHNAGGGFNGPVEIEEGTTVGDLVREKFPPGVDPGTLSIHLNSQSADLNEPLKPGDLLSLIPARYDAAFVPNQDDEDRHLTKDFMAASEDALRKVWDNPSDAEYDRDINGIKAAIARLPGKDMAELLIWLEEYHGQVWDKQIEEDVDAGRLDALFEKAIRDHEAGLSRPL